MTPPEVRQIIEWLGPEGAIAGLERSKLTNADLMFMAREMKLSVDKRSPRRQLSIELVMSNIPRIDKPTEYLLKMTSDELTRYFVDRLVSTAELSKLLTDLGISPPGKSKSKLNEYAAREISDLGMFQRVAKGNDGNRR